MNGILMSSRPSACKTNRAPNVREVEFRPGATINISVEEIVARFALPCAWERFSSASMAESAWLRVRQLAFDGSLLGDDREFLGRVAPKLVKTFHGNWSHENVLKALLEHKGHPVECAAKKVEIGRPIGFRQSPITGDVRPVFCGFLGESFQEPLFDLFLLEPQTHSLVLLHKSVIITIL